jgi:hypothetical protein
LSTGFKTEDKYAFHFRPITTTKKVNFKVRAPTDAHVAVLTGPTEESPVYEVRFIIVFFSGPLMTLLFVVHILKLFSLPA